MAKHKAAQNAAPSKLADQLLDLWQQNYMLVTAMAPNQPGPNSTVEKADNAPPQKEGAP